MDISFLNRELLILGHHHWHGENVLLVHEEYNTVYANIVLYKNKLLANYNSLSPSLTITNPGKTCYLYYILVCLLSKKGLSR